MGGDDQMRGDESEDVYGYNSDYWTDVDKNEEEGRNNTARGRYTHIQ